MSESNLEFLKISNITKSYGVVKALADVSFSVRQGEIHTILGENGAGKSTLVKCITGEAKPDSGMIQLDGQKVVSYTPSAAHAMGIHMVHQELAVFENLTVAENVYPVHQFKKGEKLIINDCMKPQMRISGCLAFQLSKPISKWLRLLWPDSRW